MKDSTQNSLFQPLSSITLPQHSWYCCVKEEAQLPCPAPCQAAHSCPRASAWLHTDSSQLAPGKGQQIPSCPPLLVHWGAEGLTSWLNAQVSQWKLHKGAALMISLASVSKHHQNAFVSSIRPRVTWSWEVQSTPRNLAASTSSPRLTPLLHTACEGPAVASCPQDQTLQTSIVLGQDLTLAAASLALGTQVTQQLTAQGPPTPPASPSPFLKAISACKKANILKITAFNLASQVTTPKHEALCHEVLQHVWECTNSRQPSAPLISCARQPGLLTGSPLSQTQRRARVSTCNCIQWQHSSKLTGSAAGNP